MRATFQSTQLAATKIVVYIKKCVPFFLFVFNFKGLITEILSRRPSRSVASRFARSTTVAVIENGCDVLFLVDRNSDLERPLEDHFSVAAGTILELNQPSVVAFVTPDKIGSVNWVVAAISPLPVVLLDERI